MTFIFDNFFHILITYHILDTSEYTFQVKPSIFMQITGLNFLYTAPINSGTPNKTNFCLNILYNKKIKTSKSTFDIIFRDTIFNDVGIEISNSNSMKYINITLDESTINW